MSGKQAVMAVLLGMCMLTASVAAQEEKNELTGVIGRIFISDQGIHAATSPHPFCRAGKGFSCECTAARKFYATAMFGLR